MRPCLLAVLVAAAAAQLSQATGGHVLGLARANVELIGIEKDLPADVQAAGLCGKYTDSCAQIVDVIGSHVAFLEANRLDFAIVNLTVPKPDTTVLSLVVEGRLHSIQLQTRQDPSLAIALFCRAHALSVADCDTIHVHAMDKSQFVYAPPADDSIPSPHFFRAMRPRQLCPLDQRLYLEIDRALDDVCFFVDGQVAPAYCGRLDRDEPMFMKANVISEPGPHFVLLTNGSQPLHAVFFTMVQPSVHLVLRGGAVAMELNGVEVRDDRTRVCLLSAPPQAFDCFNSSLLSTNMTLPRLSDATTSVTVLVINEYNKAICRSNVVHLPQTDETTPPPGSMFALPKHHPNVPPSRDSILHDLYNQEWGVYSQNGEDGILHVLFQLVPPTNKVFVEFGVEDGVECNTRYLREVHGWTGLLMDGSHADASMNLHQAWITVDNIVGLLEQHEIPRRFDLLSVDIDFNDYYVLQAILRQYTPSVIVVETNAHFRYPDDRVATYDADGWDGVTNYFGATLAAFVRLLDGYTVVYCESHGVNCFFVKSDLWPTKWTEDPATIDQPANFFGKGWSYPPSPHAKWATPAPA